MKLLNFQSIKGLSMHLSSNGSISPFHYLFRQCSNSPEVEFHHISFSDLLITTKFCTCHDNFVVMACAKFWSDHPIILGVKCIQWISTAGVKIIVKWVPYCMFNSNYSFVGSVMVFMIHRQNNSNASLQTRRPKRYPHQSLKFHCFKSRWCDHQWWLFEHLLMKMITL